MGKSPFLSEPRVSPDDSRVYFIQSGDGLIYAVNQDQGDIVWVMTCDDFEEDCANSVLSEFALSRDGRYLYYGDVTGRVIALELGNYTEAPTATTPTSIFPIDPTTWSTSTNEETPREQVKLARGRTLGGSIALIVVATLIGTGASIHIIMMNKMKTHPHPVQEHWDDPNSRSGGDMMVNDFASVPDPYEDAIIYKHAKDTAKFFPGNYYNEGDHVGVDDDVLEDSFDNYSYAPADRISHRLGTANQVGTQRLEDYSYGASVVL